MAKKEIEKEEKIVQKKAKKGTKNNKKSKKTLKTTKKDTKTEEKEEKKNKSPSKAKKSKYDEVLFNKIREDLLEQLEIKGLIQESYKNLVEDYMKLGIIKELLNKDIEKRGINIKYESIIAIFYRILFIWILKINSKSSCHVTYIQIII